jgi:hypothetical protein
VPDIRAIRVLCPVCDCPLSVLIDGGDERNLRIPCGAIADGIREHIDAAHEQTATESDGPPTAITIHVHGGVLNERDLRDVVQRELRSLGIHGSPGSAYLRRAKS